MLLGACLLDFCEIRGALHTTACSKHSVCAVLIPRNASVRRCLENHRASRCRRESGAQPPPRVYKYPQRSFRSSMRRDRLCLYIGIALALTWATTLTAMVASLLMEQREHSAALGLICSRRRRGLFRMIPFGKRRGACDSEDDDPSLPPALQKALPFLKPLKRKLIRLPVIGAGAAYILQTLPVTAPYLHFVGISLTRYVMPVAKKIEALFLLLKLSKDGKALGLVKHLRDALRWLLRGSNRPALDAKIRSHGVTVATSARPARP